MPPGLMPKAINFICSKLAKGVYKPSQGSYHSQWFLNSRKTVDYNHLSIFRHSIVLPFKMQVYLLSSTLLLNHSLDIPYILDSTFFQDMTHVYFTRRAETSQHSRRHLVFCVILAYLKDSQIQLQNSRTAQHSSSRRDSPHCRSYD